MRKPHTSTNLINIEIVSIDRLKLFKSLAALCTTHYVTLLGHRCCLLERNEAEVKHPNENKPDKTCHRPTMCHAQYSHTDTAALRTTTVAATHTNFYTIVVVQTLISSRTWQECWLSTVR